MQVSEIARRAEVSTDTVRFYCKQGLLQPRRDPDNSYQLFDLADLKRLRFIRQARALGFSLSEINDILKLSDSRHSPCPLVRDLFERKLTDVEQQLTELIAQRDRMRQALKHWEAMPDGTPDGHSICHLIEHWEEG